MSLPLAQSNMPLKLRGHHLTFPLPRSQPRAPPRIRTLPRSCLPLLNAPLHPNPVHDYRSVLALWRPPLLLPPASIAPPSISDATRLFVHACLQPAHASFFRRGPGMCQLSPVTPPARVERRCMDRDVASSPAAPSPFTPRQPKINRNIPIGSLSSLWLPPALMVQTRPPSAAIADAITATPVPLFPHIHASCLIAHVDVSLHPCRRGAATGDQRLGGASSSGFDTHLRQGVPSDPALRVVAGHIAQAWVLVSWWSSEGFVQAAAPGMQPARNPSTTFAMSLSE
ncbi:hypothetical protein B0H14DRAFT_3712283 [Mycena olivaceomarginata]|nr:hypothetical protein B0H14DRAFT_3712283 [Mycena olivaceomarginata]